MVAYADKQYVAEQFAAMQLARMRLEAQAVRTFGRKKGIKILKTVLARQAQCVREDMMQQSA